MPCQFPAQQLLELRRKISGHTGSPNLGPNIKWGAAVELMAAIDEMRWTHQEQTGCTCWDSARRLAAQGLGSKPEPTTPAIVAESSAPNLSNAPSALGWDGNMPEPQDRPDPQ